MGIALGAGTAATQFDQGVGEVINTLVLNPFVMTLGRDVLDLYKGAMFLLLIVLGPMNAIAIFLRRRFERRW